MPFPSPPSGVNIYCTKYIFIFLLVFLNMGFSFRGMFGGGGLHLVLYVTK